MRVMQESKLKYLSVHSEVKHCIVGVTESQ